MERNITNDIVTEYINGFYTPVSPELGALRLEAEAQKVPIDSILHDFFMGSTQQEDNL